MKFPLRPRLVAGIGVAAVVLAACGGQTALPVGPTVGATSTKVVKPLEPPVAQKPFQPAETAAPPTSTAVPTATVESTATLTATSIPSSATPSPVTVVQPSATPQSATEPPPSVTPVPATSTPGPQVREVNTDIIRFVLQDLEVSVGTTVTWTNLDGAPHTTSSGIPPTGTTDVWRSGTLNRGDSYTFTFESAGEFPYFCEVHPGMTATITVSEGER